jgi:phospholipase A1
MKHFRKPGAALVLTIGLASPSAPCSAVVTLQACASINDPAVRLRCYDSIAGRPADALARVVDGGASAPSTDATKRPKNNPGEGGVKTLADLWALKDKKSIPLADPMAHRPTYFIGRWTNDPNEQPGNQVLGPATPTPGLNSTEAKFQLSFKSELLSPEFFAPVSDDLRLWFAYTQQSNWQILDTERSRPFRATNFEPELILTYNNKDRKGTYGPTLVNLGFVHQSNGQSNPESRGWNRMYLQGGWELPLDSSYGSLSVLARGWWSSGKEDNPDINDYIGRGDLILRWQPNETHKVSLLARHNLRLNPSRGFVQVDWAYDVGKKYLPALHFQFTSGYGESLLDYNYRQRTFGIGLSFADW